MGGPNANSAHTAPQAARREHSRAFEVAVRFSVHRRDAVAEALQRIADLETCHAAVPVDSSSLDYPSLMAIRNEAFAPELAKLVANAPAGDAWLHEVKWDGYRIVATIVDGEVRLWSRNGIEWTQKVPELAKAVASLKLKSAQLDGEMIVPNTDGSSDFNALQGRLGAENKAPLRYMLFDAPYLSGEDLHSLPLVERKARLEAVLKKSRSKMLAFSAHRVGNGAALYAQAQKAGWEGIVSKRTCVQQKSTNAGRTKPRCEASTH